MSDEGRHGQGRRAAERGEEAFSVDLGRPTEIVVGNPNGGVVVRGAERADVLVRHVKRGVRESAAYDGAELLIEADGNRVAVRPILPSAAGLAGGGWAFDAGSFAGFNPFKGGVRVEAGRVAAGARQAFAGAVGHGVWYDLEIEVPRSATGTVVGVDTASGDVVVDAVNGQIRVRTASGDVSLRQSRGEVGIDTASGDLAIVGAVGPLRVQTASGDLRVTGAEVPTLALRTASGDIQFEGLLAAGGPFKVETVSGDVGLGLGLATDRTGAGEGFSLAFQTVSGDARVGSPFQSAGRRTWRMGAGSGPNVSVKTVSGDLVAGGEARGTTGDGGRQRSSPAPPAPPAAPAPPSPWAATAPPAPPSVPEPPIPLPPPAPIAPRDPGLEVAPLGPAETGNAVQPAEAGGEARPGGRLDVLRAVERGEIDVDEALRRLEDGGDVGSR